MASNLSQGIQIIAFSASTLFPPIQSILNVCHFKAIFVHAIHHLTNDLYNTLIELQGKNDEIMEATLNGTCSIVVLCR